MQGFFHGTGHGVGLQIHEAPSIGKRPCVLRAGHVVTVEPGLYYLGLGGVRIEDVALVTKTGSRCLTRVAEAARDLRGHRLADGSDPLLASLRFAAFAAFAVLGPGDRPAAAPPLRRWDPALVIPLGLLFVRRRLLAEPRRGRALALPALALAARASRSCAAGSAPRRPTGPSLAGRSPPLPCFSSRSSP